MYCILHRGIHIHCRGCSHGRCHLVCKQCVLLRTNISMLEHIHGMEVEHKTIVILFLYLQNCSTAFIYAQESYILRLIPHRNRVFLHFLHTYVRTSQCHIALLSHAHNIPAHASITTGMDREDCMVTYKASFIVSSHVPHTYFILRSRSKIFIA